MLGFEDLLAAKVAIQMGVVTPEAARGWLAKADAAGETLVAALERRGTAPADVTRMIAKTARRGMFLKAESVYLGLLRKRTRLDETKVDALRVRRQGQGLKERLGDMLVAEGAVGAELHAQVMTEARAALASESEAILTKYRGRGFEGIEKPSNMVRELLAAASVGRSGVRRKTASTRARSSLAENGFTT